MPRRPAADRAVRHPVRRQAEVRALRRGGPSSRPFADRAASGSSRSPSAGSRVGSTPRRPRRADGGRRRIDPRGSREPDRRRRAVGPLRNGAGTPGWTPPAGTSATPGWAAVRHPLRAGDPGSLAAGALPVVDYVAMPSHVPTIDSLPRPTPCTRSARGDRGDRADNAGEYCRRRWGTRFRRPEKEPMSRGHKAATRGPSNAFTGRT